MSFSARRRRLDRETKDEAPAVQSKRQLLPIDGSNVCTSILFRIVLAIFASLIFFFAVIPVVFRSSSFLKNSVVFMNNFSFGLRSPEECALKCTRSFLINSTEQIHLGVWHIAPREESCHNVDSVQLTDGRMVLLYIHGIGGTRASAHRVALYKVLSNQLTQEMHIIAYDYRGEDILGQSFIIK